MEIIDVSVPVRSWMPVYPGDPEVRLERVSESPALSRLAFYCLPLKLVGSDGAPARAILVRR